LGNRTSGVLLAEHRAQGRGDHALVGFWDSPLQVAGKVHPAALPAAALEHAAYGLDQAHVGIAHYELDTSEAALLLLCRSLWLEGTNEGLPETLAFAITRL